MPMQPLRWRAWERERAAVWRAEALEGEVEGGMVKGVRSTVGIGLGVAIFLWRGVCWGGVDVGE